MLLAHQRQVSDIGPHGQPMSEATDPRGDVKTEGGWHYEPHVVTDNAQLALERGRADYLREWGERLTDEEKAALQWTVTRVDDD